MTSVMEHEPGEAQDEMPTVSHSHLVPSLDGDKLQPSPPHYPPLPHLPSISMGLGAAPDEKMKLHQHSHHHLDDLPNELLLHILIYLDIPDLLSTSRLNHHLRTLSLTPHLHSSRLRLTRHILPPLLTSPCRPSLSSLITQSIFLTPTHLISKRLARSLASISLSRRLARRPSAQCLIDRAVLPRECVPPPCRASPHSPEAAVSSSAAAVMVPGRGATGMLPEKVAGAGETWIAPGLIAKKRQVEKEKMKDELRSWIGGTWKGRVREKGERVRREEWRRGTGRVWRLRRFWERVGQGDVVSS